MKAFEEVVRIGDDRLPDDINSLIPTNCVHVGRSTANVVRKVAQVLNLDDNGEK